MIRLSRPVLVAAVCAVQLALVGVAVAAPLSARLTGEEVRLRVAPVDPIDPFRGAYVDLGYPDLAGSLPTPGTVEPSASLPTGDVYVPLRRAGDVWVGETPTKARPAATPYLACRANGWTLRCGIESWFVPQARARALETAVRDRRAVAVVRVDDRGHAALVDLALP